MGSEKGCGAARAAVTLNAALPVASKFLDNGVLAFDAYHGVSPLALCEETSQNSIGSEAWLTPRFGLAPLTGTAANGALGSVN